MKRKRVLESEEEILLLTACDGPREHLRPIIICAIDTGMRRGEIFKLKWSDLYWDGEKFNIAEKRKATVREFNTKTLRERETDKLKSAIKCVPLRHLMPEVFTWKRQSKSSPDPSQFKVAAGSCHNLSKYRRLIPEKERLWLLTRRSQNGIILRQERAREDH